MKTPDKLIQAEPIEGIKNWFELNTPSRSYFLYAETEEDIREWTETLSYLLNSSNDDMHDTLQVNKHSIGIGIGIGVDRCPFQWTT